MSVSYRKFVTVPMPKAQAEELVSVCRGRFTRAEIRNWEDWSYLLLYRNPAGELQSFLLLETIEGDPVATLRALCAKERGTGLPQALVQRAEDLAREEGATTLQLELLEQDPALVAVYTKMGFVEDPEQDGWMMKSLKGGSRSSRVKKQTRRTQRKRRNTIRKKL